MASEGVIALATRDTALLATQDSCETSCVAHARAHTLALRIIALHMNRQATEWCLKKLHLVVGITMHSMMKDAHSGEALSMFKRTQPPI
jgi:uncharacterized membrane protein YgdD (TMEM256/DUF423 family)